MVKPVPYCGRFAPSPTGPLHFGSLLAACASYLQARKAGGRWLLRIEDIDGPREQPGADRLIVEILEAFGFEWDGQVLYQSASRDLHHDLINRLLREGHAYRCTCSRRALAGAARGPLGTIYPGTCRTGSRKGRFGIRVLTDRQAITVLDGLQGPCTQQLERDSGDFLVRRRDGLVAYHLAVVADDHEQSVTEIVRGMDLLDSTPRQVFLQRLLGFSTPHYLHIPVIENESGQKLSKQTGAPGLCAELTRPTLLSALTALGQLPPPDLAEASLPDIWSWAIHHWDISSLKGKRAIPLRDYPMASAQNGLS